MSKMSTFDGRASLVFLLVILAAAAPYALKPLWTEVEMSYDWRSAFQNYQNIGNQCKVAQLHEEQGLTDARRLEMGIANARNHLVPFRAEATYQRVVSSQWTYVGCDVQPERVEGFTSPVLFLGPIFGKSVVYFNGAEVRRLTEYTQLSMPLSVDQASKPFKIEIVSTYANSGAGPMSLIPWVLMPSENDLRVAQRTLNYATTEKPLVPLGVSGTLVILFLCCWAFGVRYRDVYWMIVACTAATAASALAIYPVGTPPEGYVRFRLAFEMICWASLWVAIYTFLRKPSKQINLMLFVIGVTVLYQMQWLVPPEIRRDFIGDINRYDGVWIGPIFLALSVMAFQIDAKIPNRRYLQRRILGVLLLIFGLFVLWAGFYQYRVGFSFQSLTRTSFIALFGAFMIIDLVIFQRAYFEEKSLKEEEERRRSALEDRMELGFSIQRLLMPTAPTKGYGPFKVHVFYECADMMAGDWFYWREAPHELRVLLGDVVGKGPQAAIAATSILTMCHNFSVAESKLEGFLTRLNLTVSELFQSKPISTIGAVALSADGAVRVINHGFSGWLHVKAGTVELLGQRGAALGAHHDTTWDSKDVDMAAGDRLIIFSDGVAEGPRAIKKLCEALAGTAGQAPQELMKFILDLGKSSVIDDDRTIIMVERLS